MTSSSTGRLALTWAVAALAASGTAGFCDDGDFVTCLKAKAVAALDEAGRADALPLAGPVTLVRDGPGPAAAAAPVTEHELRAKPESELDAMLYDRAFGLFAGRSLRVDPSAGYEPLEQGRGKMKKTMGMMMTVAAMKAMMIIPLALGLLFLMAGKAMIISKIALVLSLIITLKKLVSKSSEHIVHETHTATAAWPPGSSSGGYGGGGGGWGKRSSSSSFATAAAAANAARLLAPYNVGAHHKP